MLHHKTVGYNLFIPFYRWDEKIEFCDLLKNLTKQTIECVSNKVFIWNLTSAFYLSIQLSKV